MCILARSPDDLHAHSGSRNAVLDPNLMYKCWGGLKFGISNSLPSNANAAGPRIPHIWHFLRDNQRNRQSHQQSALSRAVCYESLCFKGGRKPILSGLNNKRLACACITEDFRGRAPCPGALIHGSAAVTGNPGFLLSLQALAPTPVASCPASSPWPPGSPLMSKISKAENSS